MINYPLPSTLDGNACATPCVEILSISNARILKNLYEIYPFTKISALSFHHDINHTKYSARIWFLIMDHSTINFKLMFWGLFGTQWQF